MRDFAAVIVVYAQTPDRGGPATLPNEMDGVKVREVVTEPFVAQ